VEGPLFDIKPLETEKPILMTGYDSFQVSFS